MKSDPDPTIPVPAILSYVNDSDAVGLIVGGKVGLSDGRLVGRRLGLRVDKVGIDDGIEDGSTLGCEDDEWLGLDDGINEGNIVG